MTSESQAKISRSLALMTSCLNLTSNGDSKPLFTVIVADNMNEIMCQVVETIFAKGQLVTPRGYKTLEISPALIILTDVNNNVVTKGLKTHMGYANAELQWYLKGTNKIKDIHPYEHVWLPYSDDGETANSAYGYMIFGNHPDVRVNQWQWVIEKLKNDKDSRQAVINVNLPAHKERPTKDFPCTMFLQYLIRDNKLHAFTFMRSNDVARGFRYDIYCFTEFQKMIAKELGVKPGYYYHFVTSLHIYLDDLSLFEEKYPNIVNKYRERINNVLNQCR